MSTRPIKTDYYRGKKIVRTTRSKTPENACANTFRHMQNNDYNATHAEVYDQTGIVWSVLRWTTKKLEALYEHDPRAT